MAPESAPWIPHPPSPPCAHHLYRQNHSQTRFLHRASHRRDRCRGRRCDRRSAGGVPGRRAYPEDQRYTIGTLDFDSIAREQGATTLRAATDGEMSPRIIDALISEVLDILRKVVRDQLN